MNKLDVGAGAVDEGAVVLAAPPVVATGALSCVLLGFGNKGALVEGVDAAELVGLLNKLKPPGAAAGEATGFAGVEDWGWVVLGNENGLEVVVGAVERPAADWPPRLNRFEAFGASFWGC